MSLFTKRACFFLIILGMIAVLGVSAWFFCAAREGSAMPQQQKEAPRMFAITEEVLASLVTQYLEEKLPVEHLTAHIARDGSLVLNGTISSRTLMQLLHENKIEMSAGMHLMIRLLPEKVRALFALSIEVEPQDGRLVITPERFEINDLDIAPMLLPPILKTGISDAANAYLKENNLHLGTITIEDGSIVISD